MGKSGISASLGSGSCERLIVVEAGDPLKFKFPAKIQAHGPFCIVGLLTKLSS